MATIIRRNGIINRGADDKSQFTPGDTIHLIDRLMESAGHDFARLRRDRELRVLEMICANPLRASIIGRDLGVRAELFESDDLAIMLDCIRMAARSRDLTGNIDRDRETLGMRFCSRLQSSHHWANSNFQYAYGSHQWSPEHIVTLLHAMPWSEGVLADYARHLRLIDGEQKKMAADLIDLRLVSLSHDPARMRLMADRPPLKSHPRSSPCRVPLTFTKRMAVAA